MAKNLIYSLLLDFYGELLTPKQRDLAELYYNQDLSLGEIAEIEGITRQGVHDNLRRCEEYMDELEQKLGLCAKHGSASGSNKKIVSLCENACEMIKSFGYLEEVRNILEEIKTLAQSE